MIQHVAGLGATVVHAIRFGNLVRERGRAPPRSGLPGSNVDFAFVYSTVSQSSDQDQT